MPRGEQSLAAQTDKYGSICCGQDCRWPQHTTQSHVCFLTPNLLQLYYILGRKFKLVVVIFCMLISVVTLVVLQPDSEFARAYSEGVHKSKYWEYVYEDSMNLIAKLPEIAAMIYRKNYKGGQYISPDPKLDWAANLSHMMGECHMHHTCLLLMCVLDVCTTAQLIHAT